MAAFWYSSIIGYVWNTLQWIEIRSWSNFSTWKTTKLRKALAVFPHEADRRSFKLSLGIAASAVVDDEVDLDLMRHAFLTVLPDPPSIEVAGRSNKDVRRKVTKAELIVIQIGVFSHPQCAFSGFTSLRFPGRRRFSKYHNFTLPQVPVNHCKKIRIGVYISKIAAWPTKFAWDP